MTFMHAQPSFIEIVGITTFLFAVAFILFAVLDALTRKCK